MGQTSPEQQHACGYFDSGSCLYANGQFRKLAVAINQRREVARRIGQLESSQVKGQHSKYHDEIYQLKQDESRMIGEIDGLKKALKVVTPRYANYKDTGYGCKAERTTTIVIFKGDITEKGIQNQQNCSRFYSGPPALPAFDQIF